MIYIMPFFAASTAAVQPNRAEAIINGRFCHLCLHTPEHNTCTFTLNMFNVKYVHQDGKLIS